MCRWRHLLLYFWLSRLFVLARKSGEGDRTSIITIWIGFQTWLMTFECKFISEEHNNRTISLRLLLSEILLITYYQWKHRFSVMNNYYTTIIVSLNFYNLYFMTKVILYLPIWIEFNNINVLSAYITQSVYIISVYFNVIYCR